jgi:hypothetical protein
VSGPFSAEQLLRAAQAVSQDPRPVVLSDSTPRISLDPAASTSIDITSPTEMHGTLNARGTTILVLSQSYGDGWTLAVNGRVQPKSSHILANGFANGWIINSPGKVRWDLTYGPEQRAVNAYVVLLAMFVASVLVLIGGWVSRRTRRSNRRKRRYELRAQQQLGNGRPNS